MLKKRIKDERGSAFIIAVLAMLIAVILTASFMESVSTATRLEADAARVDEAYLVAKSGMLYFERMVEKDSTLDTAAKVVAKFPSKVRGKIEGYDNAYFDIEVKARSAANEYNIICTGYYGTPGASNTASYILYKYALTSGNTTTTTTTPNSAPETTLLDYADGTYDKTLENGFEGSYFILNDTPGGKMTITNTDSSSMTFGKMVTVTDIDFKVGRNKLGSDTSGSGSGIISKGKFNIGGEDCMVPGSVYCNEFSTDGATTGFIIGEVIKNESGVENVAHEGDLHVATELNDNGQAGFNRLYTGDVWVGGDASFVVNNATVDIRKDLVVGGDLTINFINNGKMIVGGNIFVKGDVTITGANGSSVTIKGNTSGIIYIKNGTLTAIGSGLSAVGADAGGTADQLNLFFSSGEENPDFKLYKKIITEINAEFPNTERPKTVLPDSLMDSDTPVVTSLSDLGAPKSVVDVDGSTKNLYTVSEDTIFDCSMGSLLSDSNTIIMFEAFNGPTLDSENNPKDSSNAVDIYFKQGLSYGDPANPGGGKIWINDASHSGCVRFFLEDGYAPECMTNTLWAIEPVTDPVSHGKDVSDENKFKAVFYEIGTETATRYINYDYVPNLYIFSLSETPEAASTGSLVKNGGSAGSNVCVPAYILMPYANFEFTGSVSAYDSTTGTGITWDNAPKVHGKLNSNDTTIQNGKQCFVVGQNPGDSDNITYTGGNQQWTHRAAIYGVYGYFEGGEYVG